MSRFIGLKSQPYPLDPTGPNASAWDTLSAPYPRYPNKDKLFAQLLPPAVYNATLSPWLPFSFSLAYYLVAHAANRIVKRNGSTDFTKGSTLLARTLRFLILVHNAALAIYSGWTWAMMFPYVVDFFVQGWSAAGLQGVKLALCSMPTNCPHLGKYAYIFYLSKYYEVFDSVILLLKGKKVSNLQSYHHAGAIICMWIAYRYQSQPVWGKKPFRTIAIVARLTSLFFCSGSLLRVQQLRSHLDVHLLLLRRNAMALPTSRQAQPHHHADRTDRLRHLPHQPLPHHRPQPRQSRRWIQGQQRLFLVPAEPGKGRIDLRARAASRRLLGSPYLHADHGRRDRTPRQHHVYVPAACPLLQLLHALLHSKAQIRPQLPASQE